MAGSRPSHKRGTRHSKLLESKWLALKLLEWSLWLMPEDAEGKRELWMGYLMVAADYESKKQAWY
jgi:hypothetical protein